MGAGGGLPRTAGPTSAQDDVRSKAGGVSEEPALIVQTEPWAEEKPQYVELARSDLGALSEVMKELLLNLNVKPRDRILIYDFNTALSTLAMSRVFTPGLAEGACEKLGCVSICTDGLSELAARSAFVYSLWQPQVLLIRSDLLAPFRAKLRVDHLQQSNPNVRSVVVTHSDAAPMTGRFPTGPGDFERRLMFRADPALFMCTIKPCGGMYYPERYYRVEAEKGDGGRLAVAPTFVSRPSSFLSSLERAPDREVCGCGEKHEFRTGELTF